MGAIDYEKYSNMTQRQLLNSLLRAEKQEQKIKTQMQQQKELISFLKAKMRESLDKPKDDFIPFTESESYKIAQEYKATLSDEQKKAVNERVESLTNRDYNNEL